MQYLLILCWALSQCWTVAQFTVSMTFLKYWITEPFNNIQILTFLEFLELTPYLGRSENSTLTTIMSTRWEFWRFTVCCSEQRMTWYIYICCCGGENVFKVYVLCCFLCSGHGWRNSAIWKNNVHTMIATGARNLWRRWLKGIGEF